MTRQPLDRRARQAAVQLEALDGAELGVHDLRIVAWLAEWDVPTGGTIASLLNRARGAGDVS